YTTLFRSVFGSHQQTVRVVFEGSHRQQERYAHVDGPVKVRRHQAGLLGRLEQPRRRNIGEIEAYGLQAAAELQSFPRQEPHQAAADQIGDRNLPIDQRRLAEIEKNGTTVKAVLELANRAERDVPVELATRLREER